MVSIFSMFLTLHFKGDYRVFPQSSYVKLSSHSMIVVDTNSSSWKVGGRKKHLPAWAAVTQLQDDLDQV